MGELRRTAVNTDDDERVKLPLDPEEALRALLRVDPDDDPAPDPERVETPED
ncbi:MAG: hypothetical protein KY395_04775 [Actinobacteria bacterium]|nr:hypothetical protein [Actinomycetota bacterium]